VSTDRVAAARRWLEEYAPHPHPDLGRDGVVCPFMVRALRRDFVTMVAYDATGGDDGLAALARRLLDENLARARTLGPDRTYLVSMVVPQGRPDEELTAMVGRVHSILKPDFLAKGYMAGDFWPDHETVGLHSDTFRPFTSPLPILGMRPMVPADLRFFAKHEPTPASRLRCLEVYGQVFHGALNDYWRAEFGKVLADCHRELAGGGSE